MREPRPVPRIVKLDSWLVQLKAQRPYYFDVLAATIGIFVAVAVLLLVILSY
jgi:hypothetical protein